MAPDTAELLEDIDEHRKVSLVALERAVETLKEAEKTSRRLAIEQRESHVETERALQTLRRAGILPSR